MVIDIAFRNAVRTSVKNFCKAIIDGGKPSSQAKNRWKFENSADWHYGHFVGMMEASASAMYFTFFKDRPDEEKMREIEEIIEEESRDLREYFKTTYLD